MLACWQGEALLLLICQMHQTLMGIGVSGYFWIANLCRNVPVQRGLVAHSMIPAASHADRQIQRSGRVTWHLADAPMATTSIPVTVASSDGMMVSRSMHSSSLSRVQPSGWAACQWPLLSRIHRTDSGLTPR